MPDLTRFDFHVHRFMDSEDVEAMSAEEVGQYILLMCHAWKKGKAASLPDDTDLLSKYARVKKLSDRVLNKFPVIETEWGPRRRNSVLYGEWVMASERSATASEMGRRGSEIRWGGNRQPIGTLSAPEQVAITQSNHTIPTQSNQTNQYSEHTFKTISIHYSSFFGISHSKAKKHLERYSEACNKYTEDKVLEYFDRWATGNSWLKEKHDPNGLNFFWRSLEEMAAGEELKIAREKPSSQNEQVDEEFRKQAEAAVEQEKLIKDLEDKARKERDEFRKKFEEEHRDEI